MRKIIVFGTGSFIFGVILYSLSSYILPAQIAYVYTNVSGFENRAFIVLQNPLLTNRTMLTFWDENKDLLAKKYNISLGNPERIIFLKNNYKKYNKDTEDQFCFNRHLNEKPCIDKGQDILIISTLTGGMYSFSFSQPNCSFIETEQRRSPLKIEKSSNKRTF